MAGKRTVAAFQFGPWPGVDLSNCTLCCPLGMPLSGTLGYTLLQSLPLSPSSSLPLPPLAETQCQRQTMAQKTFVLRHVHVGLHPLWLSAAHFTCLKLTCVCVCVGKSSCNSAKCTQPHWAPGPLCHTAVAETQASRGSVLCCGCLARRIIAKVGCTFGCIVFASHLQQHLCSCATTHIATS